MAVRCLLRLGVLAAAAVGASHAFVLPPPSRLPAPALPTPPTAGSLVQAMKQHPQRPMPLMATGLAAQAEEEGGSRRARLLGRVLGGRRKKEEAAAAVRLMAKCAVPLLVCTALMVAVGPAVASAAATAVTGASEVGRVNRVKEYVFKPLGRALGSVAAGVRDGPLGRWLHQGWTEPSTRFLLAPPISPDDIPGRVLEAIQSRLPPSWSPLAVVALLSFLPVFEARVAVPFGLALGAPWLKALTVGLAFNAAAVPVAAALGQVFRDLDDAEPVKEIASAARERYQTLERQYQEAVGRLAAKRTQLQEEELRLRTDIDAAIAAVRKGDIVMDKATRQGLVDDITSASTALLELGPSDASQFRQQLDDQFFATSVGSVWPGGAAEGAFEEVTVADLGQRRVELAWHPDVALFPMVGQSVVAYQMDEIAAQAAYDFGVRPQELLLLRREVAALEQEAATAGSLRDAARQAALTARETVAVARSVEERVLTAEDAAEARRKKMVEAAAAAGATAAGGEKGPPAFVPASEREQEEEARVAELQMKGKLMMNYGWPRAIVYVGLPLPFSGAWTAMFWSSALGLKFGPSAAGTLLGIGLSTLIGTALWLTGPVGVAIYGLVLALLYGQENPVTFVKGLFKSFKSGG